MKMRQLTAARLLRGSRSTCSVFVNLAKYDLVRRVQSDQLSLRNGDEAQQVHADLHYRYNDLSKTNFIVNISYGFVQYVQHKNI